MPRARVRGKEAWGYCDYGKKEVVITKTTMQHGISRQVFLHEIFHKLLPWMAEDAIDHLATETDDSLEMAEKLGIM